jgi:hypothetical protein
VTLKTTYKPPAQRCQGREVEIVGNMHQQINVLRFGAVGCDRADERDALNPRKLSGRMHEPQRSFEKPASNLRGVTAHRSYPTTSTELSA